MRERIVNGGDTTANPCTEIDMSSPGAGTGEVKTAPSMRQVEHCLSTGARMVIVAPTGQAAAAMRAHLEAARIPLTALADMTGPTATPGGAVAVACVEDLRPVGTLHSTPAASANQLANPDLGQGGHGWLGMIDDAGDVTQAQLDAVTAGFGRPRPAGPGKSSAMSDAAMDSLFGDDALERERRARRSYVLTDEPGMARDADRVLLKAGGPANPGLDYGAINQRHTIRNGTRAKPTRGRYK